MHVVIRFLWRNIIHWITVTPYDTNLAPSGQIVKKTRYFFRLSLINSLKASYCLCERQLLVYTNNSLIRVCSTYQHTSNVWNEAGCAFLGYYYIQLINPVYFMCFKRHYVFRISPGYERYTRDGPILTHLQCSGNETKLYECSNFSLDENVTESCTSFATALCYDEIRKRAFIFS